MIVIFLLGISQDKDFFAREELGLIDEGLDKAVSMLDQISTNREKVINLL